MLSLLANNTSLKHQSSVSPQFDDQASEFSLRTDTSTVGLGVVLEVDGHVIAYASWSLTIPECQYSVIQRECLPVVYALKQFCHYLLGR